MYLSSRLRLALTTFVILAWAAVAQAQGSPAGTLTGTLWILRGKFCPA